MSPEHKTETMKFLTLHFEIGTLFGPLSGQFMWRSRGADSQINSSISFVFMYLYLSLIDH